MTVRSGGLRRVLPHVGDKLPRIGINFSRQREKKPPGQQKRRARFHQGRERTRSRCTAMRRLYGKCDEFFTL